MRATAAIFVGKVNPDGVGNHTHLARGVNRAHCSSEMTQILEQNYEYMRRLALRLCRHRQLAEDVLQQACMKAWQSRDRFEYGRCPKAWLARILRNEYFQIVRKHGRVTFVEDTEVIPPLETLFDPESTIEAIAMVQALSTLNKEQKEAVVLVLVYGFTYDEAANLVGSAAGTMKSRVARGRANLVQLLQ